MVSASKEVTHGAVRVDVVLKRLSAVCILVGALAGGSLATLKAATETVIYDFGGSFSGDAFVPYDTLTAVGSSLYGTGVKGGGHYDGGIFRIEPDGTGYQVLHGFDSSLDEGRDPHDGLTVVGNTLYGVTRSGGTHDDGTLFKIEADGTGFQVIHSFDRLAGQPSPHGRVTVDGSVVYGMSQYGGVANKGAVYRINTDGSGYGVLHSFGSSATDGTLSYGGGRGCWFTLAGNTLYGVTPTGGSTAPLMGGIGYGTVFKMNTDGSGYAILHNFSAAAHDGANPYGSVTLVGSTLYGNAGVGGSKNGGIVYRINTDGTGYKILHNFHSVSHDGTQPSGELLQVGASLYGITQAGGLSAPGGYNGEGTLFRVNLDGTGYAILHHFGVRSNDGESPNVGVIQLGGAFFGATSDGGANTFKDGFTYRGTGTIYRFSADTGGVTVTLGPAGAVTGGALWRLDDGVWQNSGATLTGVLVGSHVVSFSDVMSYSSPVAKTISVSSGKTLAVSAEYIAPQLTVQLPVGSDLVSGVSTADFAGVELGHFTTRTLTLKNTGKAVLNGLGVSIDGQVGDDFSLGPLAVTSLAPGSSTKFSVTFQPGIVGGHLAMLHIASNDPATPRFDVTLAGSGTVPPTILSSPLSLLEDHGAAVTLTSSASGGALSYLWLRNNVSVKGAGNGPDCDILVSKSSVGTYKARVSNSSGSAISAEANVGFVNTQPFTTLVPEGGTLSLVVDAAGPDISFEWRRHGLKLDNGVNPNNPVGRISGATSSRLVITKATVADADDYTCNVTMPDPQHPLVPLQKESGIFTVKTVLLPVMDPFSAQWKVGSTVTDAATATNQPTDFHVTGQPSGVTIGSDGRFMGKPLVAITAPTTYHLVITAKNLKGTSAPLKVDVVVQPLDLGVAGAYTGPVAPGPELNGDLGGSISPVISQAGKVTGTLRLGLARYTLAGQVESSTSGSTTASLSVRHLTISFTVDMVNHVLASGQISDGVHTVPFSAWCNRWGRGLTPLEREAIERFRGTHTFALKGDPLQPELPQGAGYGSFTVGATGLLNVVGRLADNISYTCSTFCGSAGEVLIYQPLYGGKGSVVGSLKIAPGTAGFVPPYGDNTITGGVKWKRPEITGRLYPLGFDPYSLNAVGGRYVAPTPTTSIVMGITDDLIHNNARLAFTGADIVNVAPDISFRLQSKSVFVPPPAAQNTRQTTLKITPATGYFTGGFTLSDSNLFVGNAVRPSKYYGQIVRDSDFVLRGFGYFLLADSPSSAGQTVNSTLQKSGQVILSKLPAAP